MANEPTRASPILSDESALQKALNQSRFNVGLLSLVLVVLVGTAFYLAFVVDYRQAVHEEKYVAAVRYQLSDDIDEMMIEAGDIAAEAAPEVADAMAEQLREDASEFTRVLSNQGEILSEHLSASLEQKVRKKTRQTVERYRAIIKEELPEVTDPKVIDRLVADFERVLNDLARRYYVDEFRTRLKETGEIWQTIPPAKIRPGDPPIEDQLTVAIQDWVQLRLTERPPVEANTKVVPAKGETR